MNFRIMMGAAALAAGLTTTPASAGNCGNEPCSTRTAVKGNSVIPPPDGSEFRLRGDLFTSQFFDAAVPANGSVQVNLGFTVNFGFGSVSTLFLNENGLVSFVRPLGQLGAGAISPPVATITEAGASNYQAITSLNELGVPVIAPFYANLSAGPGAGDGRLSFGDIVVQYGFADPYADGGEYSQRDLRSAVRITWYGLGFENAQSTESQANAEPIFAQLLISSDLNGLSNFEFRYGTLQNPGQLGYNSIAGFSLGNNFLQFSGPYVDGVPTFFEFQDGQYIGQGATAPVPEPSQWLQLMFGFGLLGAALRGLKRRPERALA